MVQVSLIGSDAQSRIHLSQPNTGFRCRLILRECLEAKFATEMAREGLGKALLRMWPMEPELCPLNGLRACSLEDSRCGSQGKFTPGALVLPALPFKTNITRPEKQVSTKNQKTFKITRVWPVASHIRFPFKYPQ